MDLELLSGFLFNCIWQLSYLFVNQTPFEYNGKFDQQTDQGSTLTVLYTGTGNRSDIKTLIKNVTTYSWDLVIRHYDGVNTSRMCLKIYRGKGGRWIPIYSFALYWWWVLWYTFLGSLITSLQTDWQLRASLPLDLSTINSRFLTVCMRSNY